MQIGVVLFKEAAKPIASRIKKQAQEHATFKLYTMRIGRGWERLQQTVELWSNGFRVKTFKPSECTPAE